MYESLKITAHLRCGVVSDATLPVDAILLYAAARERWGAQDLTQPGVSMVDLDHDNLLPVERVHGPQWYYHASFAQWPATVTEGQDYWNKRLDMSLVSLLDTGGKRKIDVGSGRYRSYHMPMFYRHALIVWWYVCGEHDGICRLLSAMTHIGKKCAQGWGRVGQWQVERVAEDWSLYGPDGRLMRAIPSAQGTLYTGYRPSYWDAHNQAMCRVPLWRELEGEGDE